MKKLILSVISVGVISATPSMQLGKLARLNSGVPMNIIAGKLGIATPNAGKFVSANKAKEAGLNLTNAVVPVAKPVSRLSFSDVLADAKAKFAPFAKQAQEKGLEAQAKFNNYRQNWSDNDSAKAGIATLLLGGIATTYAINDRIKNQKQEAIQKANFNRLWVNAKVSVANAPAEAANQAAIQIATNNFNESKDAERFISTTLSNNSNRYARAFKQATKQTFVEMPKAALSKTVNGFTIVTENLSNFVEMPKAVFSTAVNGFTDLSNKAINKLKMKKN